MQINSYMYMCVCMSRCLFVRGRNNFKLRLANSKELTKVEKGGLREIFLQWISPFLPFPLQATTDQTAEEKQSSQ